MEKLPQSCFVFFPRLCFPFLFNSAAFFYIAHLSHSFSCGKIKKITVLNVSTAAAVERGFAVSQRIFPFLFLYEWAVECYSSKA